MVGETVWRATAPLQLYTGREQARTKQKELEKTKSMVWKVAVILSRYQTQREKRNRI